VAHTADPLSYNDLFATYHNILSNGFVTLLNSPIPIFKQLLPTAVYTNTHQLIVCVHRDSWGRRCTQVVAIDAVNVKHNVASQFGGSQMRRELNKASL